MTYRYETQHTARSYTVGRDGARPRYIVIHHWGADGQTHSGVVDFFATRAETSAHYVASAGRVTCLVACSNTAYHAGTWQANIESIGIECRPEMTPGDLETIAELIADIRRSYGYLPLRGHRDIVPTECPGRYYSRLAWLDQRARQIQAGQPAHSERTDDMTPDQDRKLTAILDLLTPGKAGVKYAGDIVLRLDRIEKQAAQISALSAALSALSQAKGLDGEAITRAISDAVAKALEDIKITLTTGKESE